MEGFWPVFFLMVVLKIPVGALLYLVWWAVKTIDAPEEEATEPGDDHRFRRFRREPPKRPFGPRRGPQAPDALPAPPCPPAGRTRILTPPAPVRAAAGHGSGRGFTEPAE